MKKIKDVVIEENVSLKKYNTYRIDAKARYLAHISSIQGLVLLIKELKKETIPYFVIGGGSNLILDDYFDGVILKLEGLNNITINDNKVTAEAGVMLGKLSCETINNSLTGFEWAMNIPGSVGGSLVQNAGAYNSDMFENLESIKVLNSNYEIVVMNKEEFVYGYRHTNIKELDLIVIEATFILERGNKEESKALVLDRNKRRQEAQPLNMPSAGSVFRNPEGDYAGRLIEEAGLKGKEIGGAQVSLKHANFIVNTGNATSNDIKNLIKLIKKEVKNQFGVDLTLEQEIIEWK